MNVAEPLTEYVQRKTTSTIKGTHYEEPNNTNSFC